MSTFYCNFCKGTHECIACWHNRRMMEVTLQEIQDRGWMVERSTLGMYHIYDSAGHLLGVDEDLDSAFNRSLGMAMKR